MASFGGGRAGCERPRATPPGREPAKLPPFEERLLGWLRAHDFEVPAILFFEAIKPVAWILAQTVHFFTPHLDVASYLHPVLREERVAELAAFLEDQARLARFVDALEAEGRRKAEGHRG